MKIWLDDFRTPPDDSWTWCQNAEDFRAYLADFWPTEISFDHDIASYDRTGAEITGYTCLCWIEKRIMNDPHISVPIMHVHSSNPVGRQKMQRVIDKLKGV